MCESITRVERGDTTHRQFLYVVTVLAFYHRRPSARFESAVGCQTVPPQVPSPAPRGSCGANPRLLKMSDIDAGERKPPALPPKPIRASASDEAEPRTATPEPGSQPPVVPPKPVRSSLTVLCTRSPPVLPRFQTTASSCRVLRAALQATDDSCSFS